MLATSLDAALALRARRTPAKRGVDEIMVIGGSDIFADTMPMADRLEITHVHAAPEGDVVFSRRLTRSVWREACARGSRRGPDDSASFAVATYLRR